MLRCYGAFNLVPSPSSNKVLWLSCGLDVFAYVAVLAGHLADEELLVSNDISKCYKSAGCSVAISLPPLLLALKITPP